MVAIWSTYIQLTYFSLFNDAFSVTQNRGSSDSIVSDYRLDDRMIRVRSPAEATNFFSNLCIQASSGTHPASCKMGTGGTFPGDKPSVDILLRTRQYIPEYYELQESSFKCVCVLYLRPN
jgi:hypothetical protein